MQPTTKSPERQRWTALHSSAAPLVTGGIALVLYVVTLAPTVTSEDSGELITAAHCFGIPHPPGYPLWTILCGLFLRIVPIGSVAWKANLFSAVLGAIAVGILCRCVQFLNVRSMIAIASALTVACGNVYWSQSVITEVYTLNALVFSILLWLTIGWYNSRDRRLLPFAAGAFGLGMCNHHTIALTSAALIFWILALEPRLLRSPRLIAKALLFFAVALLPYAYVPIRAHADPPMNWGEARTISAAWEHVSRKQYRGGLERVEIEPTGARMGRQFATIGGYCLREHTKPDFVLVVLGLLAAVFQRRAVWCLLALVVLFQTIPFLLLQGIGGARQDIWASKVFFIPLYMLAAIPLAYALEMGLGLLVRVRDLLGFARPKQGHLWPALAVPVFWAFRGNLQDNNYRDYWYAHDHAQSILASVLPDALIFPTGDHNTFPLVYLREVEGARQDVIIADKYGYIDPTLYADMPGFEGRHPRDPSERDAIEEWIVRRARRPVYYTVKKETPVSNATVVPAGVVYHLLPEGKSFDGDEPWRRINYRNLLEGRQSVLDYGASSILSDVEYFKGVRELTKGATNQASEHFALAAEYGVGVKEVYNNIGCVLAEFGLTDLGIDYYQRAASLDASYSAARWNLARVYKSRQDWANAEKVFLELTVATPDDFRVFGELGFLAQQLDQPVQISVKYFEESLRHNPSQPQIIAELARRFGLPRVEDDGVADGKETALEDDSRQARPIALSGAEEGGRPPASETGLVFDQLSVDFGVVRCGLTLTHRLGFRNDSDHEIGIKEVSRSCGCVGAVVDAIAYAPGETGLLDIVLNTGSRVGAIEESVTLSTDSQGQGAITLGITANAESNLQVIPDFIALTKQACSAPTTGNVQLTSRDGAAFTILSIEAPRKGIIATTDLGEVSAEHTVRVLVQGEALGDPYRGSITVRSDLKCGREVSIPISWTGAAAMRVDPSIVHFDRSQGGLHLRQEIDIWLLTSGQVDWRLDSNTERIGVTLKEDPLDALHWRATVEANLETAGTGSLYSTLILFARGQEAVRVEVPIFVPAED